MYSREDFFEAVRPLLDRYFDEHAWFDWGQKKNTPPETIIGNAWNLYTCAYNNRLGYLLLGDARIRTTDDLLLNFGLTSGGGLGEDDLAKIKALENSYAKRMGLAQKVEVGAGSILSDQTWTPLLNDAYILGGVHGDQDFYWAEPGFRSVDTVGEQEFLNTRKAFGAAAPQYTNVLSRDAFYYQQRWQHYLLGNNNFWAGGLVRVFARELIGLKAFGYEALFTSTQITFRAFRGTAEASFAKYRNALLAVNYFRGSVKDINSVLGEFLFGDKNALQGLKTGAVPAKPRLKTVPKPGDWKRDAH